MDCREAEEILLASFDGVLSPSERDNLEEHISACAKCAEFAELQHQVDLRLRREIVAPELSPGFRAVLRARVAQKRREPWPEWLPDVAHVIGSAVAVGLCVLLLPFPAPVIVGAGTVISALTYLLQTVALSALEQPAE